MIANLSHCLIFAVGVAATIVSASETRPKEIVVAIGTTPATIEVDPDYFAPPTCDEIDDFAARSPMFEA